MSGAGLGGVLGRLGSDAAHDLPHHRKSCSSSRGKRAAALLRPTFSEDQGQRNPGHAMTGVVFLMACWQSSASAIQPISKRVLDFACGLRWRHHLTGSFVLFGTGVFAGALLHVGGMILGPRGDTAGSAARRGEWFIACIGCSACDHRILGAGSTARLIRGAARRE